MDLILSLTTLVLIAAGLALQIMTRRAWQTAIAAVETRIDLLEADAHHARNSRVNIARCIADTEAALEELKLREAARRAEMSAADLAKTIGFDPEAFKDGMLKAHGVRRPRPTKPEGN